MHSGIPLSNMSDPNVCGELLGEILDKNEKLEKRIRELEMANASLERDNASLKRNNALLKVKLYDLHEADLKQTEEIYDLDTKLQESKTENLYLEISMNDLTKKIFDLEKERIQESSVLEDARAVINQCTLKLKRPIDTLGTEAKICDLTGEIALLRLRLASLESDCTCVVCFRPPTKLKRCKDRYGCACNGRICNNCYGKWEKTNKDNRVCNTCPCCRSVEKT